MIWMQWKILFWASLQENGSLYSKAINIEKHPRKKWIRKLFFELLRIRMLKLRFRNFATILRSWLELDAPMSLVTCISLIWRMGRFLSWGTILLFWVDRLTLSCPSRGMRILLHAAQKWNKLIWCVNFEYSQAVTQERFFEISKDSN